LDRNGIKRSESGFDNKNEQNESISVHFNPFSFAGKIDEACKSSVKVFNFL